MKKKIIAITSIAMMLLLSKCIYADDIQYEDDLVSFSYPDNYFTITRHARGQILNQPPNINYHFSNDFNYCALDIYIYEKTEEYTAYIEDTKQRYLDSKAEPEIEGDSITTDSDRITFLSLNDLCYEIDLYLPKALKEELEETINQILSSLEIKDDIDAFNKLADSKELFIDANYSCPEKELASLQSIIRLADAYYNFTISQSEFKTRIKSLYESLKDEKHSHAKTICLMWLNYDLTDRALLYYKEFAERVLENQV